MWRWPYARWSAREQGSKGPQVRALKRRNSSRPSEMGWRWECQLSNFLVGGHKGKTACRAELGGEGPETKGPCKESCHLLRVVTTPIQLSSEVSRTLVGEGKECPLCLLVLSNGSSRPEFKFWLSCHGSCVTLVHNFNCSLLALFVSRKRITSQLPQRVGREGLMT